jgi:hypothetical protein
MNRIDWSWVFPVLTGVLIALLIFLFVLVIAEADDSYPLSCVADAQDMTLYDWGWYRTGTPISDSQWGRLLQVTGVDIWLGYPQGFDIREPVYPAYKIAGEQVEVWIWRGEQYYYVFPFSDTTVYEGGAVHPCGAYRVDKDKLDGVIDGK